MEEFFDCANCGELNAALLDLDEGDHIELNLECTLCESYNSIEATFNYHLGRYELEVCHLSSAE